MELSDISRAIAEQRIELVRFEQSDTHGISRSKIVPARHVERFARDGLNFLLGQLSFDAQSGVAMGTGYMEDRGFPDSRIFPDLATFRVLPWAPTSGWLLCDLWRREPCTCAKNRSCRLNCWAWSSPLCSHPLLPRNGSASTRSLAHS